MNSNGARTAERRVGRRYASAVAGTAEPRRVRGEGDAKAQPLPQEGATSTKTQLSRAACRGDAKVEVASTRNWRVGYKARIGPPGGLQEERFVSALGSLILASPLDHGYPVGTPVQMFKSSKRELLQFKKAEAILCVHNEVLAPIIDAACVEGERVRRAREFQDSFDARRAPRAAVVAHAIFRAENATLVGGDATFSRLLVAKGDRLKACGEGFSLSDLRRLFDRADPAGTGAASAAALAAAARDDADVAGAFADFPSDRDATFLDDCLPRLWRRDALDLLQAPLPAGSSVAPENAAREKLSEASKKDCEWIFKAHASRDGLVSVDALPAVFADFEGRRGPAERDAAKRTTDILKDFGKDALTFEDFLDARARHCADLGVPLDQDGKFLGGGINGWRRVCLRRLRPLWSKSCAANARAGGRRVDAAPGSVFADAARRDPGLRGFLTLPCRADGAGLRDALSEVARAAGPSGEACFLRWRHVEALVFGDVGAPNAPFSNTADEAFKRGPRDVLRFGAGGPVAKAETAADLALLPEGAYKKPSVLETLADPAFGLVFCLFDDGRVDAWDSATAARIGGAPLLAVSPEATPRSGDDSDDESSDSKPLGGELARRMLSLTPRCQILALDAVGRRLIINTTPGDRCVRTHELAALARVARVKLDLPKFKSFGRLGFWDAADAGGLPDPRWSSAGAVQALAVAADDGALFGSLAGGLGLRAWDLRTGSLRRVFAGHDGPIGAVCCIPELGVYASGAEPARREPNFFFSPRDGLGAAARLRGWYRVEDVFFGDVPRRRRGRDGARLGRRGA